MNRIYYLELCCRRCQFYRIGQRGYIRIDLTYLQGVRLSYIKADKSKNPPAYHGPLPASSHWRPVYSPHYPPRYSHSIRPC